MWDQEHDDTTLFSVVINDEEQYSIWPKDRALPLGWHSAGFSGMRAQCLDYIEKIWTDMRPRSLREQMEAAAQASGAEPDRLVESDPEEAEDDLVQRLATGTHSVVLSLRPERNIT
ncbi:MAG: MbtH family NRPS accessory protein, partial [Niveispirillum sp.]|nr:MbtH family NRPS accessory protein [Niveispirillum sp.]